MAQMQFTFRPLAAWPRPDTENRKWRPFKTTFDQSLRMLAYELSRLEARNPVMIKAFFSERDIRNDGMPRSDARKPSHPGIILAFTAKHGPMQMMCDDCEDWKHNVHAIVLTLERLRLADLYGVTKSGEQYAGWRQLPQQDSAPIFQNAAFAAQWLDAAVCPERDGNGGISILDNVEVYQSVYRLAAKKFHPDMNPGKAQEWTKLQAAAALLNELHGR